MAASSGEGKIPCVDQPALKAFDTDGDGVVSFAELRERLSGNPQIVQVLETLETHGVTGIRYTGCDDVDKASSVKDNGAFEDLATLIARAAVNKIYEPGQG